MDLWTALQAVILGVVEGLTEFLPISSTGHQIVVADLLGFGGERAMAFNIIIQLGAILAVMWEYRRKILITVFNVPRQREAQRQHAADGEERHETQAEHCEVGADHVGGVLGPTEPGFHHGEPGLHEDHHRGPDDHPEEVDLGAQNLHRVGDALSAGHLREQRHNGAANRGGCAKAKE